jgi:hypothetical protein
MPPQSSIAEHMAKFKEMYPEDWHSLVYRYKEHERHTPEGQPHPMPEPTQHLLNMVKNYYRKTNKVVARSKRETQPEAGTEHPQPEAGTAHRVDVVVWSQNSCSVARVVLQEPPEPFATLQTHGR